jgi:hypothetical protein
MHERPVLPLQAPLLPALEPRAGLEDAINKLTAAVLSLHDAVKEISA